MDLTTAENALFDGETGQSAEDINVTIYPGNENVVQPENLDNNIYLGNENDVQPSEILGNNIYPGNVNVVQPENLDSDIYNGNENVVQPENLDSDIYNGNDNVVQQVNLNSNIYNGNVLHPAMNYAQMYPASANVVQPSMGTGSYSYYGTVIPSVSGINSTIYYGNPNQLIQPNENNNNYTIYHGNANQNLQPVGNQPLYYPPQITQPGAYNYGYIYNPQVGHNLISNNNNNIVLSNEKNVYKNKKRRLDPGPEYSLVELPQIILCKIMDYLEFKEYSQITRKPYFNQVPLRVLSSTCRIFRKLYMTDDYSFSDKLVLSLTKHLQRYPVLDDKEIILNQLETILERFRKQVGLVSVLRSAQAGWERFLADEDPEAADLIRKNIYSKVRYTKNGDESIEYHLRYSFEGFLGDMPISGEYSEDTGSEDQNRADIYIGSFTVTLEEGHKTLRGLNEMREKLGIPEDIVPDLLLANALVMVVPFAYDYRHDFKIVDSEL